MKRHFWTGFALILPLVLTILILKMLIDVITEPFVGVCESTMHNLGLLQHSIFHIPTKYIIPALCRIGSLMGFITLTILVGFLGRFVILKYIGRCGDYIFHSIPFVNFIYKATQDASMSLFSNHNGEDESSKFSSVVLVPFPASHVHTLGFVIPRKNDISQSDPSFNDYVPVYIPGSPNPIHGFLFLYKAEQIIPITMSIDEALKFTLSCGSIAKQITEPY